MERSSFVNTFKLMYMYRPICLVIILNVLVAASAQDTATDNLLHLKYPKRYKEKYVNFDGIKLMFGKGFSKDKYANMIGGFSFNAQVLYPYSAFKEFFPLAFGINIGYNKLVRKGVQYQFSGEKLEKISTDPEIKTIVQRTGYIGLIGLRVIRYRSITIMVGGGMNFNIIGERLITRAIQQRSSFSSRNQINVVNFPLKLQLSYSRKQLWSIGIFGTYDTKPLFKSDNYNDMKQIVVGLSGAIII